MHGQQNIKKIWLFGKGFQQNLEIRLNQIRGNMNAHIQY